MRKPRILFLVTEDWFFWSHRLSLARATRDAGVDVVVATAPGKLQKQIESEQFKYYSLRMKRKSFHPWTEILTLLNIASFYRLVKPDLVYHYALKPVVYGSWAAKLAQVPAVINSIAGLGYTFISGSWKRNILRQGIEWALFSCFQKENLRVIFENPDDRQLFISTHLVKPHQTVLILGSGADTDKFVPTPESPNEPTILLASRMLRDKGVETLVEAKRILNRRQVSCTILLAGKPDTENLNSLSELELLTWQNSGLVSWIGHQTDIPGILGQSHIFCLPTSYREGLPMALAEAASCARPIVTTDTPGCREIVRDGWNGFLVPPKDPVALADALEKLLVNPELRKTMGQRGRELVLQQFSKEIVIEQTFAVYKQLLGDRWPG